MNFFIIQTFKLCGVWIAKIVVLRYDAFSLNVLVPLLIWRLFSLVWCFVEQVFYFFFVTDLSQILILVHDLWEPPSGVILKFLPYPVYWHYQDSKGNGYHNFLFAKNRMVVFNLTLKKTRAITPEVAILWFILRFYLPLSQEQHPFSVVLDLCLKYIYRNLWSGCYRLYWF